MTTQAIVVNGGSSSGKSGIVPCRRAVLPDPCLAAGVDAMPTSMQSPDTGIGFAADGGVQIGSQFRELEAGFSGRARSRGTRGPR